MGPERTDAARLDYLDQFRGYTVLGMFFVNFVGGLVAVPAIFKHHHTYCSYADTIMPQFLLAVGFAFRLTFARRRDKEGTRAAYLRAVKRILGLALVALVIHHLDGRYDTWEKLRETGAGGVLRQAFQRNPFQTLLHIAVTSLWVLPVIAARPSVRVLYMTASAALFVGMSFDTSSYNPVVRLAGTNYYTWVMKRPGIDGGPLGFLTWTVPLLVGSLACDAATNQRGPVALRRWLLGAVLLMALGYALSCLERVTPPNALPEGATLADVLVEPPFVPPPEPDLKKEPPRWARTPWMMSQRAGGVSYLVFGAGFSLAVLALFLVLSAAKWRFSYLDLLGQNALAGYIIHDLVGDVIGPFVPKDAPLWYVLVAFAVNLAVITLFLRYLERHRMYLRL